MTAISRLLEYRRIRLIALILFLCPPFLFLTILGVIGAVMMPGKNINNYMIAVPFGLHVGSWWVNERSDVDVQKIFRVINILIVVSLIICDLILLRTDGLIPGISM